MIEKIKLIKTEKPQKEVWSYLKNFLSEKYCVNKILELHSEVDYRKQKKNIDKQAKQIKYSLKQAIEYFQAFDNVSIITKPLLLYYGAVCLSRMVILFKNEGDCSYDNMRKNDSHNHHGLNLKKEFLNNSCITSSADSFLQKMACEINIDNNKGMPWGNFPLFYNSLVPDVFTFENRTTYQASDLFNIGYFVNNCADFIDINILKESKFNCLTLLSYLPDMYEYLKSFGISRNIFPGQILYNISKSIPIMANGIMQQQTDTYNIKFIINELDANSKNEFIKFYKQKIEKIRFSDISDSQIIGVLNYSLNFNQDIGKHYFPDMVESLERKLYYISNPDKYITETASIFIILFMLGMLCRYFPDIWVKITEENQELNNILDYFLFIAYRKLPNLILDQITLTKNVFY